MAIQVQLRRGTATQNNAFTGAIGELSFDTTANQVRVHDGSTAGGFKIGTGNFPTGTNNVALGNTALDDLDSGSPGGNNTAVGHDALTANTTASFNTAIGVSAGSLITTGQKNTIVGSFDGNEGGLDIRTANSHIVLSDGDGNPRVVVDDSGLLGIGETDPDRKLHVNSGGVNECAKFESTDTEVTLEFTDSTGTSKLKSRADFRFETGSSPTERVRIDSDGHVGIGETGPNADLVVKQSGSTFTPSGNTVALFQRNTATGSGCMVSILSGNNSAADLNFADADDEDVGRIRYNHSDNSMQFQTNASERMRITSSGDVLIAKTTTSSNTVGARLGVVGNLELTRSGGQPLYLNRQTNDGDLIRFDSGGTEAGVLGTVGGNIALGSDDVGLRFVAGNDSIDPIEMNAYNRRDNAIDLGSGSYRFDDIYATNGTIQTSDEREKQNIASLTEAEITAAKAISKLFKTFKWKDKVSAKGDAARTHAGVIAQQVETAMSDAGLDATNYAFFTSTTWWETETEVAAVEAVEQQDAVYDDDDNLVSEAVEAVEAKDAYTKIDTYYTEDDVPEGATKYDRKGIRYPELLAFIGAATEQRLTSIEARLDALEG